MRRRFLYCGIGGALSPSFGGGERPADVARHPSQLYEAGLEGAALFVLLFVATRMGALKRPGTISGLFALGYAFARIFSEFFREPDAQLGFLFGGATMGMALSVPVGLVGLALLWHARKPVAATP